MREAAFVIVGIVVGLVWLAIWTCVLHFFSVTPFGQGKERRERLKRLGKLKYVLVVGVLGSGFSFALAMITIDFVSHRWAGLVSELAKFVFLAIFFGLIMGLWNWQGVRDPVPFPPDYGSRK
ncbi:MAG TPA: hypothetical protein VFA68_04545 [Terriglobales bacterium]|nr:hypothetical protein [Terriglobales bacterium]